VFAQGGFDVVIGNPPYVKRQNISIENQVLFLENNYKSATYNFDLYLLFIEKGSKLINPNGILSYINPSKFTSTKTGTGLRNYLDSNCHILRYIDFKEFQIFEDVTTYCCIFILSKSPKGQTDYYELNENSPQNIDSFVKTNIDIKNSASGLGWQFKPTIKIKGVQQLKDVVQTFTGIESGADNLYILENDNPAIQDVIEYLGKIVFPIIKGTNVHRYHFEKNPYYGIIPYSKDRNLLDAEYIEKEYPKIWSYLNQNKEVLEQREKGKMKTPKWYGYVYPKNLYKYSNTRLIWTDISIKPQFVIDETKSWHVRTVCSLELNKQGLKQNISYKLLLAILNSNLFFYFIRNNSNSVRGGYFRYKPQYVKKFPMPVIDNVAQQPLIERADIMLHRTEELQETKKQFTDLLQSKFDIEKLSKKLQVWYELDFKEFLKELKKAKVTLGLAEEAEWMQYFNEQKQKAEQPKTEMNRIDKEIDQLVYELYGLTEEEIKIVEGS